MTAAERALVALVNSRIARLSPDMQRAYLRAIAILRDSLSVEEIARRIQDGRIVFDAETLDRALVPYRDQIRRTTADGFTLSLRDLPLATRPTLLFDYLNPRVVTAIRSLESKALDTLKTSVQQTVKETVESGLTKGKPPKAIARGLREVIGLAPNQAKYITNLEDELRALDPKALDRVLLGKRNKATIEKALSAGKPLTDAQVQTITSAYEKKWTAHNAFTNTRQATLDSYRTANRESYASAIERGLIPADRAKRRWVHWDGYVPLTRARPDHLALHGTTVQWDQPYPNGQTMAGFGDFNCRCVDLYFLARD